MADIESLLKEKRVFAPRPEFAKQANWSKKTRSARTASSARRARSASGRRWRSEHVFWFSPWKKVLDWKPPFAKWFVGGKTNVSYNCLDRHLDGANAWRRNKAAIIWEGEPGDTRTFTYAQLHREVCKFANVLKGLGVEKGDRVALYMPMVPELAIAMLACTRIGAPHIVVFGGFSAESLRDRINDAGAKVVVTADGGYRRGAPFALKAAVDEALRRARRRVERSWWCSAPASRSTMQPGRDHWWHALMATRERGLPAREARRRAPAVHPLHQRHHREAEGHPAHDGRLPHPRHHDSAGHLRPEGRRTSTGVRPTSAGSPATPTSCTGRSRTAPRRSCTRACPRTRRPIAGGR